MGRFSTGLRAGAGLLALVIGSVAAAQDTQPPPDVAQNPSSTASEPGRVTRSSSPVRASAGSAEPGCTDRLRRPGRHRKDGPQLDQRRAAAPAELRWRPRLQVQLGQPRQSAGRRRCRRRRGEMATCAIWDRADSCWSTASVTSTARPHRAYPDRPTSTRFRRAQSRQLKCCRTVRIGDLWLGCDCRRGQHYHQEAAEGF